MFLREKIKIQFSRGYRAIRYHFIFWNIALFFFVFLTDDKSLFVNYFKLLNVDAFYFNISLVSGFIALLFTFLDTIFSDRIMRFSPIRTMVFLRSLLYFALAFTLFYLGVNKNLDITTISDYDTFLKYLPTVELPHIRFFVYFYLSCIVNSTFKEMHRKVGVGNFLNWFFGRLNKPREEKKLFMFIDMKSSTRRAEELGHEKFSRLVQDVFNDMSVLYNYHGEIYNYLGDGAVVCWNVKKGVRSNNCIRAFYAFQRVVDRRSRYYRRKYGEVPKFKAGLHLGRVMVLQVGSIRREISYNGDTINTAARIESMCNEYKQDLLISGVLYEALEDPKEFNMKEVGTIKLKGKQRGVLIYQVKQKQNTRKKKKKVAY